MEQTRQTNAPETREQERTQTKHEELSEKQRARPQSGFDWQTALRSELDLRQLGPRQLLELAERMGNQSLLALLDRTPEPPAQADCILPAADPVPPFYPVQAWQPALCMEPELPDRMPGIETAWDPGLLAQGPGQQPATDWLESNGTL